MLTNREVTAAINWYPWISDRQNEVDRYVARKLEFIMSGGEAAIRGPEAAIITRWYSHVPKGFRTRYSNRLYEELSVITAVAA
jgi:hypothetical protein